MNQGKLDVVNHEMARVKIYILGISELKWMGMLEFNSDDQLYLLLWAKCLRGNGVALIVNKSLKSSTWVQQQKKINRMILICFRGKLFYITVIQVYVPTTDAQKAEVDNFYEDLQDLLELTPRRRYPFHQRGLECKSRKSRVTWSNRQVWPWSTK